MCNTNNYHNNNPAPQTTPSPQADVECDRWINKTRWIERDRWINKTIYKYINFSDHFYDDSILENICNEYRYSYYSGSTNEAWTTNSWKLGCSQYKL